uniref:Uncharacterized protein n=1 Tax=viral metagenome TaxID=1070528 RepID=A0A6M3X6F8_9ZZZZ
MAKKSMTIDEVKKAKIKVESDILKMIKDFENETKVKISHISLDRDYGEDAPIAEPSRGKPGAIKNVDLNMELDLLY